jgi:hypothetical protein
MRSQNTLEKALDSTTKKFSLKKKELEKTETDLIKEIETLMNKLEVN